MKKIILLIFTTLPLITVAQDACDFFKYRNITIDKTNINTAQSDFGPAFVNDALWISAFTGDEIAKLNKGVTKKIYYNLFSLKTDNKGNVTGPKNVQLENLSAGYHAGPVSYCDKTKELFVTINNFENPEIRNKVYRKADIRLKIIIAQKEGEIWKLKEELPFNDSTYSVGHPAISVTGDTLFFASDKPNSGFGNSDIYMSVRKDGKWGDPVNLGANINTEFDEMFPFFYQGSFLFYASNKKGNQVADFDVKYSCKEGSYFRNPKPLDILNTNEDDFGLIIHPNGKTGYFVSRRDGGLGDDDIYKITFKGEYNLELMVMDKKLMQPIQNPKVKFSDNLAATLTGTLLTRKLTENGTIIATTEIEGYLNTSKSISTVNKNPGILKDTLWVEKVVVMQKFVMENIYYDFDKSNILPESETELNKLVKVMNDNPSWKVELGSHTDSRGSNAYNDKLSQRRSDSAVGYIVKSGIGSDRITAKGYGETQLINKCKNGVDCTEEEHRFNRRTEFKILQMDNK